MSESEQDQLIESLKTDYRSADLDVADRRMLDYSTKLTSHPSQITSEDIDGLRQAGFADRAIHDICAITAYFAFVNRIANGLGVKMERSS